jgi:hypothetical protein
MDAGFEQWAGRGLTGSLDGAVLTMAFAQPDERRPCALDDRPDVGEVEIDETRAREQLGRSPRPALRSTSSTIRNASRAEASGSMTCPTVIVRDGDHGVDLVRSRSAALLGDVAARRSFEIEGLVTTAIVRAPPSRALAATTGAPLTRCRHPARP